MVIQNVRGQTRCIVIYVKMVSFSTMGVFRPQAAQARCKNFREFRYCFAYYERIKDLAWEIPLFVKPQKFWHNYRKKLYLGVHLACCCFFCVTWAQFMAIYTVLRLVVCSVLRGKAGDCVQSQLANLCCIKEPRSNSLWKRQILYGEVSFLSLPLVMGIAMCFLWEFFWKFLILGNLTCAQEPRWLRVAWWTRTFSIRSSN